MSGKTVQLRLFRAELGSDDIYIVAPTAARGFDLALSFEPPGRSYTINNENRFAKFEELGLVEVDRRGLAAEAIADVRRAMEPELNMIRHAMKRLYSEKRMDGDEMRDCAGWLDNAARVIDELLATEKPEEPSK